MLSLPALRRLRFPINGGSQDSGVDLAARTALAAQALFAATLVGEQGADLRSRCLLFPTAPAVWELLDRPGDQPKKFELPSEQGREIYRQAVQEAQQAGLPWLEREMALKPSRQLIALVRQSQLLAAETTGGRRGGLVMIAIGIRHLNGWSMAADSADRNRPEWLPHPDRIFMALAAAHFETDGDGLEQAALHWLERQGAPNIWASEATHRDTITTYVPVNDSAPLSRRPGRVPSPQQVHAGLQLLRRTAPGGPVSSRWPFPGTPPCTWSWPADPTPEVRDGLSSLCGKVIRVGHSASLVQAWVEDAPPDPNLVPTEGLARHPLRVSGPGRLDHLTAQYQSGRRPERSRWVSYTQPQPDTRPEIPQGAFDNRLLALRRIDGRRLGLESTLMLADKLRNAVVSHCPQPVPEWVSGHTADRRPSQQPHLAFPAPFHSLAANMPTAICWAWPWPSRSW